MKGKKNKKRILKNLGKRISMLTLSALIVFSSVFASYGVEAHAEEYTFTDALVEAVRDNSYTIGTIAGSAIGSAISPGTGTIIGGALGGTVGGTLLNAGANYYTYTDTTGTRVHGGDGREIPYSANTGTGSSATSNYYSVYNENRTYNTTTNDYDYTYNWYNPVTNTYNTTNEFYYNETYNTYNYTTYDVTNNYTTNYYMQDNSTHITYYIVETNNETNEVVEQLIDVYYELPDGRNSYYLTAEDIHGQYFISNYSQYVSVAEDDGTTLGLWHLDGNLKDSSYWNNTIGESYTTNFVDSTYTGGYKFGDTEDDYLQLNLDNVELPETWTLEWVEYTPNDTAVLGTSNATNTYGSKTEILSGYDDYISEIEEYVPQIYEYYYDDEYYQEFNIYTSGYLGLNGGQLINPIIGSYIPYAVTYDGDTYKTYRNGKLIDSTTDFTDSSIKVSTSSKYYRYNLLDDEMLTYNSGASAEINIDSDLLSGSGISVDSECIKFSATPTLVGSFIDSSSYSEALYIYDETDYATQSSSGIKKTYAYVRSKCYMYNSAHKNSIVDEVRLSSGVLYTENYTPSSQPFETNNVLVVPENPDKHEIAFRTNVAISALRVGGVRPTYPVDGYIYIALDDELCVEDVQQYQSDGWYSIEASLYVYEDTWTTLDGFNMEYLTVVDSGSDSDSSSGSDSDSSSGSDSDSSSGSDSDSSSGSDSDEESTGIQAILDGIGNFFDAILTLIGKVVTMISDFVNSVLETLNSFTVFTEGFSGFLSATFAFLPDEAIAVIISGITLLIILAVIKFLK